VTQLQDALLRLDAEWEQAVRGRDRDIEDLQTEHDEAKAAWKEVHESLGLSRVELEQLRENCDGLVAARDVAHDQLRVVQDELHDAQDELSGVQDKLSGVQDELSGAQDELVSVQNELSGVQDDVVRTTAELSHVTSKRDASQAQLDAIRRSHGDISLQLAARKVDLHQCIEAHHTEYGRLQDLRGEVGTLTKSLERTQQSLSEAARRAKREEDDARARLSGLHGEIQKADEVMAARAKQARDQHYRDSTLLAEVQNSLSVAKREKDIEISRLQDDVKAMRDSFTHMQNEARSAKVELAKTRRSHEEAQTALAVIVARRKKAESEAEAAMAAASRYNDAAHQAKEELADIKAQILNAVSILERKKTVSDSTVGAGLLTDSEPPAKNPSHIRTDPVSEYGGATTVHVPGTTSNSLWKSSTNLT
jgi:chromosome segregation ATPase